MFSLNYTIQFFWNHHVLLVNWLEERKKRGFIPPNIDCYVRHQIERGMSHTVFISAKHISINSTSRHVTYSHCELQDLFNDKYKYIPSVLARGWVREGGGEANVCSIWSWLWRFHGKLQEIQLQGWCWHLALAEHSQLYKMCTISVTLLKRNYSIKSIICQAISSFFNSTISLFVHLFVHLFVYLFALVLTLI